LQCKKAWEGNWICKGVLLKGQFLVWQSAMHLLWNFVAEPASQTGKKIRGQTQSSVHSFSLLKVSKLFKVRSFSNVSCCWQFVCTQKSKNTNMSCLNILDTTYWCNSIYLRTTHSISLITKRKVSCFLTHDYANAALALFLPPLFMKISLWKNCQKVLKTLSWDRWFLHKV